MNKLYSSPSSALNNVLRDGMTIMVGGFGVCGTPENLVDAIIDDGVTDLVIISNNCALDHFGIGKLLEKKRIRKIILSYFGGNNLLCDTYLDHEIEVEIVPQGTLSERIRAAKAGIAAFFTKTAVGTMLAHGKEVREFDNKKYIMEHALHADLAIIKAYKADKLGNVIYRKTARNFNQTMAGAANTTICEVEQVLKTGELQPDSIHTPGIYVQKVILGTNYQKPIEHLTIKNRGH